MSRTSKILIGILVIQLVVWAIASTDRHHVQEKERFLSLDTSLVDYVHIVNKDGELTMKRVGGHWKITDPCDYPANPSYTKTLIEKVAGLELEAVITDNPDKYVDYELDDTSAAYIEIGKDGGVIDKFYCGKPSKNYTHTYMRRADSDKVLLVAGTPRSSFTRRPNDWRDKKILNLDQTMIERILLSFPDETVELVRDISTPEEDTTLVEADTSWQVIPRRGSPFTPDEKVFNRIMNTLSRMNAMDFMTAGTDTIPSFARPDFTVEIFLEGDQHVVVDFIPKPDTENRWIARKDGDESTVFVIYQSSVKNLKKRPADLKPEKEA